LAPLFKIYVRAFVFAFAGIGYAFRSQFNMRFHVFAAIVTIAASVWLRINRIEWCIILFCISSVIAAELINTSIEYNVDLASPGRNDKAGQAKDMAAAAVLVVCVVSVIIGSIIFVPKIISLF
jgi:diacylglycerol kinase